jgi:PAS domain S-box-containing protein
LFVVTCGLKVHNRAEREASVPVTKTATRFQFWAARFICHEEEARSMMKTAAAAPEEQDFILSSSAPSLAQKRLALGVVLVLLVAFLLAAGPLSTVQLVRIDVFVSAYAAAMFVNDSITAVLLFAQFSILRSRALLAISSGYVFTALMLVPWMLTFPGLFASSGLLGAGLQSTAWLYILWHAGFPAFVIAYALLKEGDATKRLWQGSVHVAILSSVAMTAGIVCAAAFLVTAGQEVLPRLMLDTVHLSALWPYAAGFASLSSVLAIIVLWARRRSVLDLWLMVVMCAFVIEICLISFPVPARYSVGWYAGRICGLLSGSLVLFVLLYEITTLYARRAENAERNRAQEALRESEERLQDIIDNTTAVVFVKDLDLRFVLINREFERRFQVQRDQIRGKIDFDVLPDNTAQLVRGRDQQVIEAGVPLQFEQVVPSIEGERHYVVVKFLLRDRTGKPYGVCGIATDITESKRTQEMQAALARERETFALQRAAELGRANEALRGCLDALASVHELDDFLGQVMATMTRQLGAISSTLRVRNFEQNTLPLELVFQDGRVMSPDEAKYPENWRNVSLVEERFNLFLDQPSAITRTLDPHSPIPDGHRSYLLGLGVKTILIIPLTSSGQVNGRLTFRFTEERDFHPEELEIARALATQASLAIQLTRLAKTARQSAVLEERNQLAGEIHDSLAQFFTGISMQLGVAKEVIKTGDNNGLPYIERASELAQYGLADARRSAFSLRPTVTKESGLIEALQKVAERSNIPGSLRCNFRSHGVPEESLPPSAQQELLRIAQEAISNAVRHAKPTVISVDVRWEPPNLVLEVTDNGSGIANPQLASRGGFGLSNMRARAEKLGAQFDVQTAASRGTSIVVLLPIN